MAIVTCDYMMSEEQRRRIESEFHANDVKFTAVGGWPTDVKAAKENLELGSIYEVEEVVVGGWYSYYILKEFPDHKFNTVMFEKVV